MKTGIWLLALGWGLASVHAAAQETAWYDIEIIVFENTDPGAGLSETWPDDPGFPTLAGAKELIPPGADPVVVSELEPQGATPPALQALGEGDTLPSTESSAAGSEQPPGLAGPDSTLTEPLPVEVWVPFLMRPEDGYQLKDIARKLDRSGRYKVLSHTAWRQALERGAPGTRVHFHSDMKNIETYQRLTRPDLNSEYPLDPNMATFEQNQGASAVTGAATSNEPLAIAEIQPSESGMSFEQSANAFPLDGTLTVRLSRYLHLDADLIWQRLEESREEPAAEPTEPEGSAEEEPIEITVDGEPLAAQNASATTDPVMRLRSYRLQESRRMRSKELHYLDHPVYGIMALITPVDEAAKKAEQP